MRNNILGAATGAAAGYRLSYPTFHTQLFSSKVKVKELCKQLKMALLRNLRKAVTTLEKNHSCPVALYHKNVRYFRNKHFAPGISLINGP